MAGGGAVADTAGYRRRYRIVAWPSAVTADAGTVTLQLPERRSWWCNFARSALR